MWIIGKNSLHLCTNIFIHIVPAGHKEQCHMGVKHADLIVGSDPLFHFKFLKD